MEMIDCLFMLLLIIFIRRLLLCFLFYLPRRNVVNVYGISQETIAESDVQLAVVKLVGAAGITD